MVDGTDGVYIDGSIVSNAAVSIARTIARNVDVILVDAQSGRADYPAMRDIYFQTLQQRSGAARGDLPPSRIHYLRPATPLAPDVNAFSEQSAIDEMFARGEQAAQSGFSPYVWQTFHL